MGESTTDTLPHLCPHPHRGDFLWLVLGKQFCKYFLENFFLLFHKPPPLFLAPSPLIFLPFVFFFFLAPILAWNLPLPLYVQPTLTFTVGNVSFFPLILFDFFSICLPTCCFQRGGEEKKIPGKKFPYFPNSPSYFPLFCSWLAVNGMWK